MHVVAMSMLELHSRVAVSTVIDCIMVDSAEAVCAISVHLSLIINTVKPMYAVLLFEDADTVHPSIK